MRVVSPGTLWGLALLPLIVLLYMLRSRRQPTPASSVLLWQRARRDLAAQLPIRRLERSLLLALQLLAVLLAVLALAQPQLLLPTSAGNATVIVMDISASMQATDVRPSRFDEARRQALNLLADAGGPVMIITAGARPQISTAWVDRQAAARILKALQLTDGPARLDQAIALAAAQRSGPAGMTQRRPRVVVFTDRAQAGWPGVAFRIIGTASRNLGIAGIHAERTSQGTHLVVQVQNSGSEPQRVPVAISLHDRRIAERTVVVPAWSTASVTATVTGEGVARAELEVNDALAVDNVAYAIVGAPSLRALAVGDVERPLADALEALGVRREPAQRVTAEALAAADVVILNGTPPVELPPGNYLLIGTIAANLPVTTDGMVKSPTLMRWARTHPVMRYVDLGNVQIAEALALRPSGGEILAEGEVPLIWAYEGGGIRAVVLGFSLVQSDLPLHVAFPILLSNALDWLAGVGQSYQAGEPLVVSVGAADHAVLTDPTGATHLLPAEGGRVVVPVLERAGVYALSFGQRRLAFAVNVPAEESQIAPVAAPVEPSAQAPESGEHAVALWKSLLAAALVVLMVEWILWLRSLPRAVPARPGPRPGPPRHGSGRPASRQALRPGFPRPGSGQVPRPGSGPAVAR